MIKKMYSLLTLLALLLFIFIAALPSAPLAQEKTHPWGTLRVVDFLIQGDSVTSNYAEGLVTLDKDNNFVPCLAGGWRWIDERTIEFRLRRGVPFHNGETFNAEAVRINWEAYKMAETPTSYAFLTIADETSNIISFIN